MAKLEEARARRAALATRLDAATEALTEARRRTAGIVAPAQQHRRDLVAMWASATEAVLAAAPPASVDGWGSARWDDWEPAAVDLRVLRIGEIRDRDGRPVPAMVPLVGAHRALVIRTRGREAAVSATALMQSIAARLALMFGPSATFHLLDPEHEGRSFPLATAMPNVARRSVDVTADLEPLFVDAARLTREHPDRSFEELPEELRAYERFNLVLVPGFPKHFDSRAVAGIHRAARFLRAGVLLVVHHDLDADRPGEHDDLQLENPYVLEIVGPEMTRTWHGFTGSLVLDGAPPADRIRPALERIAASAPGERIVDWASVNSRDPAKWWTGSSEHLVRASVGLPTRGGALELKFGVDEEGHPYAHTAQAAATGAGKSVLFHSLILGLTTQYSPDELNLYLVDGKAGSEFQIYVDLPHAKVVSLNTAPELAASVLDELVTEMNRRYELFQAVGADEKLRSFDTYRARVGMLPRIVLVVDEYGTLFGGDQDAAVTQLLMIAEKGRAAGIHLYLASQGFSVRGLRHRDDLFRNVQTRVALQMPAEEIDSLTEFKSEGRSLLRSHATHVGRAVINSRGGEDGSNTAGKVALVTDELAADVMRDMARKADEAGFGDRGPVVFRGRENPRLGDSLALGNLARVTDFSPRGLQDIARRDVRDGGLGKPTWLSADRPLPVVLGRELSVSGTLTGVLERRAGENMVIVGSSTESVVGMLAVAVASASLASAPGALSLAVLGIPPVGGSWDGLLETEVPALLGARGHATVAGPADDVLGRVEREIATRSAMSDEQRNDVAPLLLVATDLDRRGSLVQLAGDYGTEPSEDGARLLAILRTGPATGVHTLLGFRSVGSLRTVLPDAGLRLFRHRAFMQISEDDSLDLLGTTAGTRVQPRDTPVPLRAGYVDVQQGGCTYFLPFTTAEGGSGPSGPWLARDLAALLGAGGNA